MKYCTYCGKEIMDEAMICVGCGCAVQSSASVEKIPQIIEVLAQRLQTNAVIWLVIGILQILGGLFINWFLLIVGVLNIVSSVNDMKYSKKLRQTPQKIVEKFEPLTGPVITMVYNLVLGGVIGVIGSIYYLTCIRSYVMEHKETLQKAGM